MAHHPQFKGPGDNRRDATADTYHSHLEHEIRRAL
jgi:hypothetical protein